MQRVYFSFDYQRDLFRARKIHQLPNILSRSAGGFQNSEIWSGARRQGDAQVQGLINDALINTTVTVVLIGGRTAYGKFLDYELEKSLERGNGLVGVRIIHMPDQENHVDKEAPIPPIIERSGFKIHDFRDKKTLLAQIEEAAKLAKQYASS